MTQWAISSSVLLAAILLLRSLFRKKISPKLQYGIWALALLRLLLPFSLFILPGSVLNAPIPGQTAAPVMQTQIAETIVGDESPVPEPAKTPRPPPRLRVGETEKNADQPNSFAPDVESVFHAVWLWGAAAAGCWFLSVNALFALRLKRSRQRIAVSGCALPVYVTDAIASPCLFGLFRPAIYLTARAAKMQDGLRHVIAHETCHFRQNDHIWSVLRVLCAAFWWWNPLVWAAAVLSKTDAEIACDETTIRQLGKERRLDYGRTLVDLVAVQGAPVSPFCTATTMGAGKRELKERIERIARPPGRALPAAIAVALLALLCAGCAFSAPQKGAPEPDGNLLVAIECDEPIYEIAWHAKYASGGVRNADNTPFGKGDSVALSFSGAMGYTLQALDQDGKVLAEGSFADDFSGDTRVKLMLTAELQFVCAEQTASYAIYHYGTDGELLYALPENDAFGTELAKTILMDAFAKSAVWPGEDVSALSDYYLIRQSFPSEIHEYVAFVVTEGEVSGAVLQNGRNGHYSRISDELYLTLVEYMEGMEQNNDEENPA